jgi:hypothetical protein
MTVSKLNARVFYPARDFDARYRELVELALKDGWSFGGVDLLALQADIADMIQTRNRIAALEAEHLALADAFARAQWGRYQQFAALLNAARGLYRNDEEKVAMLSRFKQVNRRVKKAPENPAPKAEPKAT